ncbi:MAG: hypothetical protein WCP69_10780 [Bacteroidota bacterium]
MKINTLLFFCLITIGFSSCKKDTNSDTSNNTISPIYPKISGITFRDDFGQLLGETDSSDWRIDDQWSQIEKNLFINSNFNSDCNFSNISVYCYPNPSPNRVEIAFCPEDTTLNIELNVVNQRFQKIYSKEFSNQNLLNLKFDSLAPNLLDTIFRVYYRITNNDNCVRCGHGDVLRKK